MSGDHGRDLAGTYDYDEEIPYSPDFDEHAAVENLDTLNVSLPTGFVMQAADRRYLVYGANHLFRRQFGLHTTSTRETGLAASTTCLAYRTFRRAGLLPKGKGATRAYSKSLRVDPVAPLGFSRVAG